MTPAPVRVRVYCEHDWPAVGALLRAVLTEGETYTGDPAMPDAALRAYWLSDRHTVVAEADDVFLGTAHMGPNRPFNGAHVGTASFLVTSSARGRGVGRTLGEYAVDWHRTEGFRAIQFNAVVETNAAAVRLWRSLGFTIVGTVPGAFRRPTGEYVGLHVMHLDLTD
ncbi:GNAT family N-acetyltransferase [Nocardioides terrisoli]|uniref:GNAT family N-acetyltransferase n=1 Tax=Nocardioides terrisoli TaxID=3388267 RepID=UPI00287B933E|nr:GNAT family N-acetyltransferase [Nocardioides marmorisolisilvae]